MPEIHFHPKFADHRPEQDGYHYEMEIYNRGLDFERPPLTFQRIDGKNWHVRASVPRPKATYMARQVLARLRTRTAPPTRSGEKLQFPIALAPVRVLKIFNLSGEIAATKAAAKEAVPYIFSSAAAATIEDVAEAIGKDGQRRYQLYWPSREHDDITISLLSRAKKAGYGVLFVTLYTYIIGWRPSDMDNGYNPFMGSDRVNVEPGLTDPVFRKQFKERHGVQIEQMLDTAALEWMQHWDGPIILKGIQTVGDAVKAVEAGVQVIIVSNHGGRQQDGGNSSPGILPHIKDAVGDKLTIFFDSGVGSGVDIAKAMALGADCTLIGRPYVYGLALGGEQGVSHVLKSLVGELELTLHLSEIPSVDKKDLNRSVLVQEDDLFNTVKGIDIH
ncbi:Lactate 2-monooxygenase [Ascochyta rabiei]|uniref:Lactate 2-monooxygenase n=1 Tax=Didymella rabiei TaxID=5454 RepID=UPI00220AF000|nr:Lactate 2-monooxygenase [Ascochyta rabiei]UPX17827.1 Lactate 2-monooxygenase [Ascochyta rabiei]